MLNAFKHALLPKHMNRHSFKCHSFLDTSTLTILEISAPGMKIEEPTSSFHWLLIQKSTLIISELQLKSRDDSASVQERFFDLGYLKFDHTTGVFISQQKNELHPLENLTCTDVPESILNAVEIYLSTQYQALNRS